MEQKQIKKIIFTKDIYKRVPWDIPIEIVDGTYLTGQELDYQKMIGEEPLTEAESKKYPYVVNPLNFYKITHFTTLDLSKPYDKALYNLIVISKKVAKSKGEYDDGSKQYVGYFFDEHEEAKRQNSFDDLVFEAMKLVRALSIEKYASVILLYNYVSSKGAHIPPSGISIDVQRNRLLQACKTTPEDILKCFPEHNKGIEQFGYILDLINAGIIRETASKEFFFEARYLGNSIEEVLRNIGKSENEHLKQIFDSRLAIAKGGAAAGHRPMSEKERRTSFLFKVKDLKSLIFDENNEDFIASYQTLLREYPDLVSDKEFRADIKKIEEYFVSLKDSSDKEKFIKELEKKDLEGLKRSIASAKTPYNKDDCADFWDDEEKLREYMIATKYPDAE